MKNQGKCLFKTLIYIPILPNCPDKVKMRAKQLTNELPLEKVTSPKEIIFQRIKWKAHLKVIR